MAKEEEFLATIVKKHIIGEDFFIVSVDHIAIGHLDKRTQIFTDKEGNSFAPMSNPWIMASDEVDNMYDCVITVDQMKEVAKDTNDTLSDAIKKYENMCKKTPYFVGKAEDGSTFTKPFNIDQMRDNTISQDEVELENDTDEYSDDNITVDNLQQLILDIGEGKYSKEELKTILDSLQETDEDMQETIGFIEDQLRDENEEVGEKENSVLSIKDVFGEIQKTLINQDEPTLRFLTDIAQKQYDSRKKKEGILLLGERGVGKTELMNLVAKHADIPVHRIDASKLIIPNAAVPNMVGTTIEEELWNLYEECDKDINKAQRAILFFDKVDDWISPYEMYNPEVVNIPLDIINGRTYYAYKSYTKVPRVVKINTKDMIVVLEGSYTRKNDIGFLPSTDVKKDKVRKKGDVNYSIPKEFLGRMNVIKLNNLDLDSIKKILTDSNESATRIQQELFEQLGVKLTFTGDYIEEVANRVASQEMGAHGLSDAVNDSIWRAFYEVQSNSEYGEVIMDKESVNDSSHFQLVKKKS